MLKRWPLLAAIGITFGMATVQAAAVNDASRQQLAEQTCNALKQAAAAIPGDGPMILPSYPDMQGDDPATRALQDVGFVYDNALAGIALSVCGEAAEERRIADTLLLAPASAAAYQDGRLRHA